MPADPDTPEAGIQVLSDVGHHQERLSPIWVLTFGVPGFLVLFFWGMAVLIGIRFDSGREVLFRLAFAIPAVELVRLPFLLSGPSPRPRVGDFVLALWGLLVNAWFVGTAGGHPVGVPFFLCMALYGLAVVLILIHGSDRRDPGDDAGSRRAAGARAGRPDGTITKDARR